MDYIFEPTTGHIFVSDFMKNKLKDALKADMATLRRANSGW